MNYALEVKNLTVHYDKQPVLWEIKVEVSAGRIVGIIGPNGAGKSTFLKSMLGIVKPLSGDISFFGLPFSKVQKRISYVPQKESIDWHFPITVFDVVLMGCYGKLALFQRPRKEDKRDVWEALDKVGLASFAKRQIDELSGGQKQRLFFARAWVQKADIYFMDEPFQGIDMTTEKGDDGSITRDEKSRKNCFYGTP